MFNSVGAAILEHSGKSTVHHGIFLGPLSLLGRPVLPKMVSIKIFTVSRDLFGLPYRSFAIHGLFRSSAVFPVVFLYQINRPGRLDAI